MHKAKLERRAKVPPNAQEDLELMARLAEEHGDVTDPCGRAETLEDNIGDVQKTKGR